MNVAQSGECYEFEAYRIELAERTLFRDDAPVRLSPKSFDLLAILVKNSGRLLAKEFLLAAIWPDVTVEENSLPKAIAEIRRALNEGPRDNRFIATVARRGYRFIPIATAMPGCERQAGEGVTEIKRRERDGGVATLAVLPLTWLTREGSDGPLAVGISDALITRLSNLPQLIVRPTSSIVKYQGDARDAAVIGAELDADYVISGSLQQVKDRLRVTVQMIQPRQSRSTWAHHFEETARHVFTVEDSLAEKIATALALKFTGERPAVVTARSTRDDQAWQLHLRGRYFLSKRTFASVQSAIECFHQALAIDAQYVRAWIGLADAYILIGLHGALTGWLPPGDTYPQAKQAALEALRIDDASAEAHASLGFIHFFYDWDATAAKMEFHRSFQLQARYVNAQHWYAMACAFLGEERDALAAIEQALDIEPVSPLLNANKGYIHYFARNYDAAILQLQLTIDIDSSFAPAHHRMGLALDALGRRREAIHHFEEARRLSIDSPQAIGALGYVYGCAGNKAAAQGMLERLSEKSQIGYVSAAAFAEVHFGMGNYDAMFEALEKALQERTSALVRLRVDPRFDDLRSDSRFQELIRKVRPVG